MGKMIVGPLLPWKHLLKTSLGRTPLHCLPKVHNHVGQGLWVKQSTLQRVLSNFLALFPSQLIDSSKLLAGRTSEPRAVSWLPAPWTAFSRQDVYLH
jgi:hypothetical protein